MEPKTKPWKSRWHIDDTETVATHDSGLRVRLQADGLGVADNGADIVALFEPLHGQHNAPAMVQRLLREGAQMLIDPYARGWRH